MKQPITYTEAEFLKFYNKLKKTEDALQKAIGKFTLKDHKVMKQIKELVGLEEGFAIDFDEDDIRVSYSVDIPNVTVFYQVKLIIKDLESGKDISKYTYLCGMIKNGISGRKLELRQILPEKKLA